MPKKKRGSHDEDSLQYLRKKMEKLQKKLEKCDKAHRRLSHHKRSGSPRPLSRSRSPVIEGKRLRSRSRSRSSRRRRRRRATSPSTPPAPAPPTPRRRRARRPRSRTPPPAHRRRSRTPRSRSRSRHSLRDCSRRQNEGTHEQAECDNTKVVQSSQNVITQMNVDTPQEAVPSSVAAPVHVDENVPTTVTDDAEPTLDSTILEILGDDPAQNSVFGPEIQKDLALRLEHCATNGLSKENRQDLKNKYLLPSNCKLINAPVLNAEITAALTDPVMKRVKAIELRQQHLASAISALSQALTRLMAKKDKDHDTIKYLMDASRILCDCQYSDSMMRRFFVLTNLKKDLKNQLQQTKIDNLLFGENFAETLRTAKAINKSGSDLKVTAPPKPRPRYTNKNPNPTPGPSKPLNWRGPNPPRSRQVETPRTREPAARGARQWTSSKPSQHPPRRNTRR